MRVIIIDSSLIFRKTIGTLFGNLGYEVILADTIKNGLKIMSSDGFDMVLVANQLDDGLGVDFAKKCRHKDLIPPEVPIFLTTTSTLTSEFIHHALSHGITEIMSKNNVKLIYDQLEDYAARKLMSNKAMSCTILYIEDDMAEAKKTTAILAKAGATTSHFTGTDGVLDFIAHNPTSLIISDVLVEGEESVLSLIYRLRTSYSMNAIIPVLILTGSDNLARRIEFFHVGIDDYLVKPFIEMELLTRIKNLLIKRQFMHMAREFHDKLSVNG